MNYLLSKMRCSLYTYVHKNLHNKLTLQCHSIHFFMFFSHVQHIEYYMYSIKINVITNFFSTVIPEFKEFNRI